MAITDRDERSVRGSRLTIQDSVDEYLKLVDSAQTDFKQGEEGYGIRFLFDYFKPVSGESMLKYFDKIINFINNNGKEQVEPTGYYTELDNLGKETVNDMAVAIINYTDENNNIQLNSLAVQGEFVQAVDSFGRTDDKSKFIHADDSIATLDANDVAPIINRMATVGSLFKSAQELQEGILAVGPALLDFVGQQNAPQGAYDLVLDLFAGADAFNNMSRVLKKLKYISSRGDRGRSRGEISSKRRYVGEVGRDEQGTIRETRLSIRQVEEMYRTILEIYSAFLSKGSIETLNNIITADNRYQEIVSDMFNILNNTPFDIIYKEAYIKARIFEGINQDVFFEAVDGINPRLVMMGLYYLSAMNGASNLFTDVSAIIGITRSQASISIPEDYSIGNILNYTYGTNDTIPLLLLAELLNDERLGNLIKKLYTPNRTGDYTMSADAIEAYIRKSNANFSSSQRYKTTDLIKYINVQLSGAQKTTSLSEDEISDFAELVNNALYNNRG
jgi:hypothetical protein